jgi:hypothetical protein
MWEYIAHIINKKDYCLCIFGKYVHEQTYCLVLMKSMKTCNILGQNLKNVL